MISASYIDFMLADEEAESSSWCIENKYFLAHIELPLDCYWHIVQMEALKYNVTALLYKLQL
jgi:hypothetical protein